MITGAKANLARSQEEDVYPSLGLTVDAVVGSHSERSIQTPISPTLPPATAHDSDQILVLEHRAVADQALIEPVETLAATIKPELATASAEIPSKLDTWANLHGIATTPDGTTREVIATQAAVYLLLQSTLYEWHHQRDNLPALAGDTQAAFREASDRISNPAFDRCVLDDVNALADPSERDVVVDERTRLLASTQPAEDIGRLYEAVVPREHRQALGQFRTPPALADVAKSWATSDGDRLLDPGVGAGSLSSPLHPDWELSTEPDHIDGIDRSPLSVLMSTTALTLLGQPHDPYQDDFFDLQAADLADSIDAVVANPPFTQGSDLPASYKQRVNEHFEDVAGVEMSAQSPLYAYFIIHARTAFLEAGDRAAVITPWNWLATQYGTALKAFLCETCSIEAFVKFDQDALHAFGNADTTTLVTFVEARSETGSSGTTRFIRVDDDVDERTIRETVQAGRQGETGWGHVNVEKQTELVPEHNWQTLFDPVDIDTSGLSALSKFCSIHRGPTTGCVAFFCLTQRDVDSYGINQEHLSPLIRKPSLVDGYDFTTDDWTALQATSNPVWLLTPETVPSVPESIHEYTSQIEAGTQPQTNEGVLAYLRDGVAEYDLADVNAVAQRSSWYCPRQRPVPRVVVQYAGRDELRFVLNETEARILNSAYGLYDVTLADAELKTVLAYLHSTAGQQAVQQITGARHGDLQGFGVTDLRELPVINPHELDNETVVKLADAFDDLRAASRRDGDTETVRKSIDALLESWTDLQ